MAKPGTILQLLSSSPAPDPLDHTTVYLTLHDTVSEIVILQSIMNAWAFVPLLWAVQDKAHG